MALSREQKKFVTIQRYRRRLQHRLDDIDWEIDVLDPVVKELAALESAGKKVTVELEVGDESQDLD